MPGREQPGDPIEWRTKVIAVAFLGGAGVQCRANADGADLAPGFLSKGALGVESGPQRGRGRRERGAEGVANGLEDVTTVCFDGRPEDGIVTHDSTRHQVGESLPELGASCDVGEEKGYSPAR